MLQRFRFVVLAALMLPVFAQDPPAPTAPPGPILVLKTAKAHVAAAVAMRLEHSGEMPEVPANGHLVVSLGQDRKVKVETGAGEVGLVDLVGDPGALMDLFAEDIEAVKPMFQGTMTLALQAQGMTPKEVAALVKSIFDFPKQLRQVALKVIGDPLNEPQDGIDVTLALEPKAGAGFAAFVDALQPCAQGAPVPGPADALLQLRCSLAPDSLVRVLQPFRDFTINLTNQGVEERRKAAELYDRWIKIYDGSIGASFGEKFQGHLLIGVLDAGKLQQLLASEDYLAMMKGQKMSNRDIEIEVTPDAFEHRGVKLMKSVMSGYPPNPMMPDGSIESFVGAAGNYLLVTFGGEEAAAKAAIDAVADQKVKRAPLPDGALIDMTVSLKGLFALVGSRVDEDMPERMTMSVGKRGKALSLHAVVK